MDITALQWNIGGGRILEDGKDTQKIASYNQDGMAYIVSFLKNIAPDIITLQEVHGDAARDQAAYIAEQLEMDYYVSDFYEDSHLESGQRLGNAIISKYPIKNITSGLFLNLHKEMIAEDGSVWHMHNKAYMRGTVTIGQTDLEVATTHLSPLRKFDVAYDSSEGRRVLDDVQSKLLSQAPHQLIQADFNLDLPFLAPVLSELLSNGMNEVPQEQATTPKQRRYDHVLYKGLQLIESRVSNAVLTDHYPVIAKFSL